MGRLKNQEQIPSGEIWLKIGGDKGGKTMKLNFQIMNCVHPNSPTNTCVFSAFEAPDTRNNILIALERYQSQIQHLKDLKWRLEATFSFKITSTKFFLRNSAGEEFTFKLFLSGDYEFLCNIYGLSGASGNIIHT